jgi:folate-binding protein YgfZ
MNQTWQEHLARCGAVSEGKSVTHFGNQEKEQEAVRSGTVLMDLSAYDVIKFSGEDTQTFLQGQLTNDIRLATPDRSQYSGYCTPKGRMLATFLIWRDDEGYNLQLPASLREAIQKRLSMFILRSKVKARDASDETVRIGIAGAHADQALRRVYPDLPQEPNAVAAHGSDIIIALPGGRYEIVASPEKAAALWDTLTQEATPVGSSWWTWFDIQAGVPTVTPSTQEEFVPQMVNYELIGGVNFQKGCYPGQEIVARTQYLGKLKRRMYLAHTDAAPAVGQPLYSPDMQEQSIGMIVNAHASPLGGHDVLAVIQSSSQEAGEIHLGSLDGPQLRFLELPYTLG